MRITRKSLLTGTVHTLDLPVTCYELDLYYAGRALIQDCFPNLTDEQREFILSGITPEEWAMMSVELEDEE